MTVSKTGYGAGTREYPKFPNALRMMYGKSENQQSQLKAVYRPNMEELQDIENQSLTLIETNLDDISSEILGYVMERAFEHGALDCWFTPIQMKKSRPATMISILCENENRAVMSELLFLETTTLGVRISEILRACLPREKRRLKTEFGAVDLKIARLGEKIVNVKPEFESLKKAAVNSGLSLKEIEKKVLREFEQISEES
jgi:uncharacterized protein (DUF111 family)